MSLVAHILTILKVVSFVEGFTSLQICRSNELIRPEKTVKTHSSLLRTSMRGGGAHSKDVASGARLKFDERSLSFRELSFLEGLSEQVDVRRLDENSVFLSISAKEQSHAHLVSLGNIRCKKFLACSRQKLWWNLPHWGQSAHEIPPETQFLLMQLDEDTAESPRFAALFPVLSGPFRSCLTAQKDHDEMFARVESGDSRVQGSEVKDVIFVSCGDDPFQLIQDSFRKLSQMMGTFRVREDKHVPESVETLGWCTWNAFYSEVEGKGILQGLASLAAGGTPARVLIIDDGWQDTRNDEIAEDDKKKSPWKFVKEIAKKFLSGATELLLCVGLKYYDLFVKRAHHDSWHVKIWRSLTASFLSHALLLHFRRTTDYGRRLVSPRANERFLRSLPGGDLGSFVKHLKSQLGVQQVFCWHALAGYWSGLLPSSPSFQSLSPSIRRPSPMDGILEVEPSLSWDPLTLGGIGLPRKDHALNFYDQLHSYLRDNFVDGLKVDAQAAFTMLGEGSGGSVKVTQDHIHAMEESVSRHFGPSNCINCMCHPTECLYSYKTTCMIRASDDFWPDDPASHTTHLVNVAYNSLFLGEIGLPDWDMFQTDHPTSYIHAIARAVGGCAIYVSDKPEKHNFELLSRLVLADGSILRARQPGRPTRDCLFLNVMQDDRTALKVWNVNHCNSVLAAFNLQGANWCKKSRRHVVHREEVSSVSVRLRARDVEDNAKLNVSQWFAWKTKWSKGGKLMEASQQLVSLNEEIEMELEEKECAICTFSQVHELTHNDRTISIAVLGLYEMFNAGGAVLALQPEERCVKIAMRGPGSLLFYSSEKPQQVKHGEESLDFEWSDQTRTVKVPLKFTRGEIRVTY